MRGFHALVLVCLAAPALLAGQARLTVAEHIARGDSAYAALAPQQALAHYRAAVALDSLNYEALWKAGRELVDIAKQVTGKNDSSKHLRDSLYTEAREQFAAIEPLPIADVLDREYKQEAKQLLEDIKGEKDET